MLYALLFLSVFASAAKALVSKKVGADTASVRALFGANVWLFGAALTVLALIQLVQGEGFPAVSPPTYGLAAAYSLSVLGTR